MMPFLKIVSQITLNFLKFVGLPLYQFLKWFHWNIFINKNQINFSSFSNIFLILTTILTFFSIVQTNFQNRTLIFHCIIVSINVLSRQGRRSQSIRRRKCSRRKERNDQNQRAIGGREKDLPFHQVWYFALTYCEKKLFYRLRKTFGIARTNYSKCERSEQFLVTECFFNLLLEVSHI